MHQLTARRNGFIEFAALGDRKEVWHGLGQYLPDGQTIEQWQTAAGMDWDILESNVRFQTAEGLKVDTQNKVLYRSDSTDVLGIVSEEYHVVQPKEVLEFFREFTETNKMKLSAAGTLFGGKRFWATAEVGKNAFIVPGDEIKAQLLLVTSADGSLSTQAKFTSTRTVCNNTLQVALRDNGSRVRKTHASAFDPKQFKVDLGLIDTSWDAFVTNLKGFAEKKVTDQVAEEFFKKLVNPKNIDPTKLTVSRQTDALMHFYKNGAGAEFSYGTQWGILNAVTEMATHGTGKRDASHQFNNSEFGVGNSLKNEALSQLLALA